VKRMEEGKGKPVTKKEIHRKVEVRQKKAA
jgi:hypothetical protein